MPNKIVTVQFRSVCAGGDHVRVDATMDGSPVSDVPLDVPALLSPVTVAEAAEVLTFLLRVHGKGLTRQQLRNDLVAGITMSI